MYTPRIASEVFDTAVIKTDEAVLLVQVATENGASLETAYEDMKMIDDLLHMKKLHIAVHGHIKTTKAGHLRKGTSLFNSLEAIIDGRVKNEINGKNN